jgi:4-hydroxy-tetrahydrodipicolinate synthase
MPAAIADRLQGMIPPVVTPLTEQGAFDRASAENLYRSMLDVGVNGLFLFGTSGEGPLLNAAQQAEAVEVAVKVAAGRAPVLVGVLEAGTDRAIALARSVKDWGADGLVVCPPFYFPATQADVLAHFRAIREAVDLPILAYDIPVTTKVKIELATMLTLAQEGTIVAVKDSSGDMVGFRRLLLKRPPGLKLFTGAELMVDAVLLQGADGTVPGLGNVAPEAFVKLIAAWREGRMAEVVEIQSAIVRLFEVFLRPDGVLEVGYALGSMKTALKLRGVIETNCLCRPFPAVTPEHEERVRTIMTETGFL